jgi:hypothetical protein
MRRILFITALRTCSPCLKDTRREDTLKIPFPEPRGRPASLVSYPNFHGCRRTGQRLILVIGGYHPLANDPRHQLCSTKPVRPEPVEGRSIFFPRHYRIGGTQCVLIYDPSESPQSELSCLCEERRMRRSILMLHRTRRSGILPRPSEDQSYPVISNRARNLFFAFLFPTLQNLR